MARRLESPLPGNTHRQSVRHQLFFLTDYREPAEDAGRGSRRTKNCPLQVAAAGFSGDRPGKPVSGKEDILRAVPVIQNAFVVKGNLHLSVRLYQKRNGIPLLGAGGICLQDGELLP